MAVEHYVFDPDGDLLLILTKNEGEKKDQGIGKDPFITDHEGPAIDTLSINDDELASDGDPPAADEVHFLVSSKHMILASPVFKAMLHPGRFQEGLGLAGGGKAEVPLPDDDPEAFRLLLQIIHHRTKKLPRAIDLEMLFSFTILVDKYQMVEAVVIFVQWWVVDMEDFDLIDHMEVLEWLTVAWVFKMPEMFTRVTQILELESYGNLAVDLEAFPIPTSVIAAIEDSRSQAISDALELPRCTIQNLQNGWSLCNWNRSKLYHTTNMENTVGNMQLACNSLLLGSLQKSLKQLELFPLPSPPFKGLQYSSVKHKVKTSRIHALCEKWLTPGSDQGFGYSHGLKEKINKQVDAATARLEGLDINSF